MMRPGQGVLEVMEYCLSSRIWRSVLVFFTTLLLFGSQIQEMWTPKEADIVFDILFSVALGVFLLDMLVRTYVEPQYFGFNLFGNKISDAPAAWGSCRLGSFMFWCDLISTLTLLYDISFINRSNFEMLEIEIELNSFGMPVSRRVNCLVVSS